MKIILTTLLIVLSSLLYSQDSIVKSKRYLSVDLFSGGAFVYGAGKDSFFSTGLLNINLGVIKKEKSPFINVGMNTKSPLPVISIYPDTTGWAEFTAHLGIFLLKKKRVEGTVATGFSYIEELGYASTSKLRLVYKLTKYFGIGTELYVNINKQEDYAALRLSLHFSNGL